MYNNLTTQGIGCGALAPSLTTSTLAATGSATPIAYPAFGFMAPISGTLASCTVYFSSSTGSPTDVRASLYADGSAGKPVTTGAIASSEGTGVSVSTAGFYTLTFGTGAVIAAGTKYHTVIKNYTASTTANPQYYGTLPSSVGSSINHNTTNASSATADNWGSESAGRIACLHTLADGKVFGLAVGVTSISYTTELNRCFGSVFTSPPYWFVCDGVCVCFYKAGALPNSVTLRLYVNGCLKAESEAVANGLLPYSAAGLYMPISPTIISPNSTVRAVVAYNGGSASNYARVYTLSLPTGVKKPLDASYTLSTDGGVTWTDTTDRFVQFWLQGSLQNGSEFPTPPINRRTSTGR